MDITIETILAKIDHTVDDSGTVRTFGIRYLKKGGEIGEKLKVRKGVKPTREISEKGTHPRGKIKYNLKSKGVIKLYDVINDDFRDYKVGAIFQFRDHGSSQWLNRKSHG